MTISISIDIAPRHYPSEDDDYRALCAHIRDAITAGPLFTTDATGLYDAFLAGLPESRRQHYECRTCRAFVERFGGLVTINENGLKTPVFWPLNAGAPFFCVAVADVGRDVLRSRVTGVFLGAGEVWGTPSNKSPKSPVGEWSHMHARPPASVIFRQSGAKTADQVMAERREEYGMLLRGLHEFPIDIVRQAHALLTSGELFRSEKCVGVAKWLLDLHEALGATKNERIRENLAWRAVATAPAGFCHVRSTMIGTMLEELKELEPIEHVKRSFNTKMDPLYYRRPQAAPNDGQIKAAEKLVEQLGIARSLERRYARLEEIRPNAVWTPPEDHPSGDPAGVFGHLRTPALAGLKLDLSRQQKPITWEKFRRTVLPEARRIECLVPSVRAAFFGYLTAVHVDAPPILQWDTAERRNPVSWFVYINGSNAADWSLSPGTYVDVDAITTLPTNWGRESPLTHFEEGMFVILRGARNRNHGQGLALFPEILKSELHGARSVIEAHSNSKKAEGTEQATACGLVSRIGTWEQRSLIVTTDRMRQAFIIDRWD